MVDRIEAVHIRIGIESGSVRVIKESRISEKEVKDSIGKRKRGKSPGRSEWHYR